VRSAICGICSLFVFSLFGCSTPASVGGSGRVLGGNNPVANATVQLYEVGTTGDGAAATALLTQAVTTDADGNFSLQGLYKCPSPTTEVYVTATGGSPSAGTTNPNLAMMTALGTCSSLSSSKPIVVNELTTVAAVNALTPYVTSYTAVGSSTADAAAMDSGFTLASELVDPTTGLAPGANVPSGYTVPVDEINELGDVATACVDSGGGVAGDGSACGSLFSLTTLPGAVPPTNTVGALLNLAKDPELNTGELYELVSTAAPYQPVVPGSPLSFAIGLGTASVSGGLELGPETVSFPTLPLGSTSGAQDLTLMNTSNGLAAVTNIAVAGTDASAFTETNNCPASLKVGAFCTILVTFSPVDTRTKSAMLQVNGGAPGVALSGAGGDTPTWPATLLAANPSVYLNFNDTTANFSEEISGLMFSPGGGEVTAQQPGFDSTTPNNTSAAFAWNAWNAAPNNDLGAIEWDVPWTMLVHIDRLNWNRTGTLTLASKGDTSSIKNNWWTLTLGMAGASSQLCFTRNGAGVAGNAQGGVCTGYIDAMPNGFNYDIVVEDNGTGEVGAGTNSPSALSLTINGVGVPTIPAIPFTNTYSRGFGYVSVAVSGGSGYANTTAFTASGGGPNCHLTGIMTAVGGVPKSINSPEGYLNYGCTSVPTIALTTPTGTGAVITATLGGASMNSSTAPLVVPGYLSAGTYYGVAGTTSTQTPTNVDEFAIFPSTLNTSTIETLYSETKFYQGLVKTKPNVPAQLVFDDDGCSDADNIYALSMAIAADKLGYVNLVGVVDTVGDGVSEAMYRQMLNQAGLSQVPVSVPSSFTLGGGLCNAADINTYDAETNAVTPQTTGAYTQAAGMYRTILAANPTTPVYIVLGGSFRGVSDLMQSSADAISSLTGAQLVAQNAANGGAILAQGLGANIAFTGDNTLEDWKAGQYVVTHNGSLPIYWYGGTPQSSGPSVLWTRTKEDPAFLLATRLGTDARSAWDSMPTSALFSSMFAGGVTIAISGKGAGYADTTAFTSTGGGPNCSVTGVMDSVNGVPSTIVLEGLSSLSLTATGVGSGCTSAPTIVLTQPTGKGAVLTATPTMTCGTVTINSAYSGSTSTAQCSNHYFVPLSLFAQPSTAPIFQWFVNSLIDPPPGSTP
jgi:hypothetical protein